MPCRKITSKTNDSATTNVSKIYKGNLVKPFNVQFVSMSTLTPRINPERYYLDLLTIYLFIEGVNYVGSDINTLPTYFVAAGAHFPTKSQGVGR